MPHDTGTAESSTPSAETTRPHEPLRLQVDLVPEDDFELATMHALVQIMEFWRMSVDQEPSSGLDAHRASEARVGSWFAERYG